MQVLRTGNPDACHVALVEEGRKAYLSACPALAGHMNSQTVC